MSTPLRPDDPRRLGGYHLRARLGEGGMGAVFLAHDADDRRVAIKLIRPELAADPAFRARFRSEVRRARQVPPFCTAAVLDADPEHPTPYLVVEYVEGASLEEMVRRDGPLRDGALHSVAIGVATALAAIHSAGVIHRDLKPANVLLSLGTPKVIDFGIARAAEAPTEHTRPDQMVGTIAYMAPERFDTGESRVPAGPAMDVFAWGVLVAYAATGTTPFAADSPVATAARILTQPPGLDGLDGPMRDLVSAALAKDPASRPSAHELLGRLLAVGANLTEQPQVQWAALAMRNNADAVTEKGEEAAEAWAWVARRRRRRAVLRNTAVIAGLAALVLAVAGAGAAAMDWRVARPAADPFRTLAVADPLRGPGAWMPAAACVFSPDGLTARRSAVADQRCTGPDQWFADPIIAVSIAVPDEGECAAVWVRATATGAYRVTACQGTLAVAAENEGRVTPIVSTPMNPDTWYLGWTTLTIVARGSYIDADLDGGGPLRAQLPATGHDSGRIVLGVVRDNDFQPASDNDDDPLNERGYACFADVRVWEP
ncbi:serine/threonine-protein kinase [Actinoplanes sp. CA-015351]|uniref:serine/threonine-protein kinase n=1 Tax=Actinoplanes sp. CA-015351 TaxID=3239897 RepID=UPI003D96F521